MAPKAAAAARKISQEAFDAAVRENVDDLGMDEEEALEDAVHTFKLQGVDLTGIITNGKSSEVHPVVAAIKDLENVISKSNEDQAGIYEALERLKLVCTQDGQQENASIAVRNGGIKPVVSACKIILDKNPTSLPAALEALLPLLIDEASQREFDSCNGTEVIVACLEMEDNTGNIPKLAAQVVAASSSGNEVLKEKFMQQKVEEILVRLINYHQTNASVLTAVFDALRSLVIADDDRVLASNAFRNGRRAAKAGVIEAILGCTIKEPAVLPTLCTTLKALSVNEEICNSVAAIGGLELVLQFLDNALQIANISLARNACSLLAQLAGSDANKDEIVSQGGCQKLVTLASCYFCEVSVLQEIMSTLACLCLRAPANATKAVEAGALDLAAEVMEKHPSAGVLLRQTCQMLRNLAVRNLENRPLILEKGLENLIRNAKSKHPICKDAASAALRDLGLDDYN